MITSKTQTEPQDQTDRATSRLKAVKGEDVTWRTGGGNCIVTRTAIKVSSALFSPQELKPWRWEEDENHWGTDVVTNPIIIKGNKPMTPIWKHSLNCVQHIPRLYGFWDNVNEVMIATPDERCLCAQDIKQQLKSMYNHTAWRTSDVCVDHISCVCWLQLKKFFNSGDTLRKSETLGAQLSNRGVRLKVVG